jgi:hypothetical protein
MIEDIKSRMIANIDDAKSIFEDASRQDLLNSQEFINWQDELNAISVKM